MLTTVALFAALTSAIGQADGLTFSHVRQTYYLLGPVRTDDKLLAGDSYNIAFDIEGLKVAPDGKVQYEMGLKVINSAGKTEFGSEPTPKEVYNALGGSTVPAYANVDIGLNQAPGKYTLKVTVIDTVSKAKQELTREFEVLPKAFGLVRLFTTADGAQTVATGPFGVPGQSLFVHFFAVGFERDPRTKQPNISIEMKIVDENGKPTLEKPRSEVIKAGIGDDKVAIPIDVTLHLNRPGKFVAEFTAVDQVSNKTVKLSLPITVFDLKESR
jgi:hypothetical protein